MKMLKQQFPILVLLLLAHPLAASSEKALISFRGEYLGINDKIKYRGAKYY